MKVHVRKRTAMIVTAVVFTAAGVVTAAVASSGTTSRRPGASAAGPIEGQVHTIRLRATATAADAPAQATAPFSLLGVVWDAPHARLKGTVRVRTRSAVTGAWSAWRPVTVANDDVPDGTGRERSRQGATAPLWVGPSNGVSVRVAGRRTLPAGLRAVLIDPGSKRRRPVRAAGHQPVRVALAADTVSPDPSAPPPTGTPSATPTAPSSDSPSVTPPASPTGSPTSSSSASTSPTASTAPRPPIVSRAAWGADESLVASPNAYGKSVKVVFVHHTDTGND
jgi:hypothetical protein